MTGIIDHIKLTLGRYYGQIFKRYDKGKWKPFSINETKFNKSVIMTKKDYKDFGNSSKNCVKKNMKKVK